MQWLLSLRFPKCCTARNTQNPSSEQVFRDLLPRSFAYTGLEMSEYTLFSIVLAAGASSRFGAAKQLAVVDGATLVTRAVRMAETICGRNSVLVAGRDWQDVAAACEPLCGFLVVNEDYADGMAGSLKAGVGAVAGAADAILLMLADQPLVTTAHLRALVEAWQASPANIVASFYAGTAGPPVIFPREFFGDLMLISGDRGARAVLDANTSRVQTIKFEPAGVDIDRPGDLAALQEPTASG
jgi:molybdenum cofactor cytidylyltransferase